VVHLSHAGLPTDWSGNANRTTAFTSAMATLASSVSNTVPAEQVSLEMASSVVGKSSIASLALHFSLGCYGAICKLVQDTIARRIQELGKLLQATLNEVVPQRPLTASQCPEGWTAMLDMGKCLRRYGLAAASRTSWSGAENACVAMHGNLVSVHSKAQLVSVAELCYQDVGTVNYQVDCAIGLQAGATAGVFTWTDGSPYDPPETTPTGAPGLRSRIQSNAGTEAGRPWHIEGHYGTSDPFLEGGSDNDPYLYVCQYVPPMHPWDGEVTLAPLDLLWPSATGDTYFMSTMST